ncbi:hypothetical protein C8J57DRAFT_1718943 [Mycena rebaudengoi]|nr:hypothetical protein C8J57DRAFT_1718943 [Mycena rebaudengoi]
MDNNTSRSAWPAHIRLRGACEDQHALTTEGVAISNRSPKVASVAALHRHGGWYIEGSLDNPLWRVAYRASVNTFFGAGRRLNNARGLRIWVPTKMAASEIAGLSTPLINVRYRPRSLGDNLPDFPCGGAPDSPLHPSPLPPRPISPAMRPSPTPKAQRARKAVDESNIITSPRARVQTKRARGFRT